jgi:hypothetical protein
MRTVGSVLLALALACSGGTEPNGGNGLTQISFTAVQGPWTFQVQPNTACPGGATIGTLSVSVNQTSDDVGLFGGGLFLENATSTWSGGGQPGGYVTGQIPLLLPGGATFNLVLGMPVNGVAPTPARVATIQGALAANLSFTGTLTDPNTAQPTYGPIFSTGACTYQITGRHG